MSVLFGHKTVESLKVFTFVPKDLYFRGKRRDRSLLMSIVRIVRVPPFPFISRIFSFSFLFCVSRIQVNFPLSFHYHWAGHLQTQLCISAYCLRGHLDDTENH